jgi:DOPA 4,5-dioxygenase
MCVLSFVFPLLPLLTPTVPELRIYKFWEHPVGPHPVAMFEVNVFTPAQFGAFIPWLVINRGPLSVLVHPNTVEVVEEQEGGERREVRDEERDHTQRAMWMGERVPLDLSLFKRLKAEKEEPKKE